MVLVTVTLVRVVHVPGLISMMLMGITLVSMVLMLVCVVLVIVALVRVVHVPRLISVVFVTVTLVCIVAAHPVLLPLGDLFVRLGASTLRWLDSGNVPAGSHFILSVSNTNHPHLQMQATYLH